MNKTAIMITALVAVLATAMVVGAVDKVEIRGAVQEVVDGATVTWTPQNFAGFYYDIDDDLGNEQITMTITGNKLEEPNGVKYTSTAQDNDFDFEDWGWYRSIGFLGENYFAGYSENKPTVDGVEIDPELYKQSTDTNTLVDEQLLKVLIDDDTERTFTSGTPLKLADGYELMIKSIDVDGNKVYVELMKDGQSVDTKVVSPSKDGATMSDKTYYYKKDIGDTEDLVIIGVHFKNAFRGADQDIATVDGIFQVSDQPMDVSVDTEYDKMRISSVTRDTIEMDNKDNAITLNKNKDTTLMAGIHIKTADQDVIDAENPLRFYIYKEATIEAAAPAPVVEEKPAVEEKPVVEEKKVEEAAPVNVTEEKPAVEEKVEEAAPAEEEAKPPAEEKGAPGFEAVFAVTGLLAVAYLVTRRN